MQARHANGPTAAERRWAWLRLGLSFAQVFGSSLGAVLVLTGGVTTLALLVVVATGLCTTASLILFGGRKGTS